jgi:hypothetical protein
MAEVMAAVEIASSAFAGLKALYQVYIWAQEIRHYHEDIAEFVQLVDEVANEHQKLRNIRIKLRGSKAPADQIGGCLDSERRAWVHLAKADKILAGVYKDGQKDSQSSLLSFLLRERWVRRIKEESRECRHDLNTCCMMLSTEVTKHDLHAQTLGMLDEGFKFTSSQIDMIRATLNSSRG